MKKHLFLCLLALLSGRGFCQSGFVNADFEASPPGSVTSPTQTQGWIVKATQHPSVSPGGNTCNLMNYGNWGNPGLSTVISNSLGLIDNVIGPVYPIFSVFGTAPSSTLAALNNPSLGVTMQGKNFFRLNGETNGTFQVEKLSKTIQVSPGNDVLELAYMFIFYPGHQCCDAPTLNIFINGNSCPYLQNTCQTTSATTYYEAGTGLPANPNSYNPVFSKWRIVPLDLSQYMGQSVTIDIIAAHCTAGGHPGYAYIDARGSSSAKVNDSPSSIGVSGSTLVSCANTATLSAPLGYLNYHWSGPGGFSSSAPAINATVAGTYTLTLVGTTTCSSVHKVFSLSFQQASIQTGVNVPLPCPGDSVILTANGASSYTWNTGAISPTIQVAPLATTIYTVWGKTGNCSALGTHTLIVGQGPPLFMSTSAPLLCLGDSATLLAFGASSFTWSTGSNAPSVVVSPDTTTSYFVTGSNGGCSTTSTLTQVVQNCTGISNRVLARNVNVFPNPAGDFMKVECDLSAELRLFSQYGTMAFNCNLSPGVNTIKLDQIVPGIYFAEIKMADETRVVKIVKQ